MLTKAPVRNAKPGEKLRKIFGRAEWLALGAVEVSHRWRGETTFAPGVFGYHAQACERCQDARRLIAEGINSSAQRKAEKAAVQDTFEALAHEYFDVM